MNLNIRYGQMTMALIGHAALHRFRRLLGEPWMQATIDGAVTAFEQDFAPISDMRASAAYRMRAAKNLLRKYFAETQLPQSQTRLVGPQAVLP